MNIWLGLSLVALVVALVRCLWDRRGEELGLTAPRGTGVEFAQDIARRLERERAIEARATPYARKLRSVR